MHVLAPRILLVVQHYKGEAVHPLLSWRGCTMQTSPIDAVYIQVGGSKNPPVGTVVVLGKTRSFHTFRTTTNFTLRTMLIVMTKLSYAVWSFNANIKTTDLTRGAVCAQICFTSTNKDEAMIVSDNKTFP